MNTASAHLPDAIAATRGADAIRFLNRLIPLGKRYHPLVSLLNTRHGLLTVPFGPYRLVQPAVWRKQLTDYLLSGEGIVPEFRLLAELVREVSGGSVLDVGANVGMYTLLLRSVTTLPIIAYEPQPFLHRILSWNIAYNRLPDVEARNLACGAEEGEVAFSIGINGAVVAGGADATDAGASGGEDMDDEAERVRRGGRVARVRVTSLDRDLADRGPVSLIKMDIEGFEFQALRGARALMEKHRPRIFLEIHPKQLVEFGSSCRAVLDILRPLSYGFEFWNFAKTTTAGRDRSSPYPGGYRYADENEFLRAAVEPARHTQDFVVARPL
jgi:FkbM family methyltransferase